MGLGSMGAPLAGRLLPGNQVYGTNRTRAKASALTGQGLIWRDTPREAAAGAQVVFSMVTDDAALAAVTSGPDGILAGLWPGTIYVNMSTVSPQASRELARQVRAAGATMIDAPVSGSVPAAGTGTLAIMAGGPDEAFQAVAPLLRRLGEQHHPRRRERPGPAAQTGDQHQPRRADARLQRGDAAGRTRRDQPGAGRPRDDRIRDRVTDAAGTRPPRPRPARAGMVRCAAHAQRHPPRAGSRPPGQRSAARRHGRRQRADPGRGAGLRAPRHRCPVPGTGRRRGGGAGAAAAPGKPAINAGGAEPKAA